jgi:hypothetical protein
MKQTVYFLGKCVLCDIVCQETEVAEACFLPYKKALELLTFDETRNILKEAENYIQTML